MNAHLGEFVVLPTEGSTPMSPYRAHAKQRQLRTTQQRWCTQLPDIGGYSVEGVANKNKISALGLSCCFVFMRAACVGQGDREIESRLCDATQKAELGNKLLAPG